MNDTPEDKSQDIQETSQKKGESAAQKAAPEEEEFERPKGQPYDFSKFKILIVEDFVFISELLSASLQDMGIGQVVMAANGGKAQNALQVYNKFESDNNIDVILLDWLMPEMGGEELLQWIRNHADDMIKFLPVVICSAYATKELVEKTRDLGATEVLVKPISAEKVANRIESVVSRPRPFLKTPDFFGPDRRRKKDKFQGPEKRKTKPKDIEAHHEQH